MSRSHGVVIEESAEDLVQGPVQFKFYLKFFAVWTKPSKKGTAEARLRTAQNQQLEEAGTVEKALWAVPFPMPILRQISLQERPCERS